MVEHESNKWHLKPLLHYSSAPKQRIFGTVSQDIHTETWRTEGLTMQGALIPGLLSGAICSDLVFHISSQASTVNAHINLKQSSSKLTQQYSCSPPQSESQVNPPCSVLWGCRTAVSSGTGYLNPSSDQYKGTSYSKTQAEQLIPWTLQLFIMRANFTNLFQPHKHAPLCHL